MKTTKRAPAGRPRLPKNIAPYEGAGQAALPIFRTFCQELSSQFQEVTLAVQTLMAAFHFNGRRS